MKIFNASYLLISALLFIISCEEEKKCVSKNQLQVEIPEQLDTPRLLLLYTKNSLGIYAPVFITPNNDGVNDIFKLSTYAYLNLEDVISSGFLEISNNCETIYSSDDLLHFYWNPSNTDPDGQYNANINIMFTDLNQIDTSFVFEVHR